MSDTDSIADAMPGTFPVIIEKIYHHHKHSSRVTCHLPVEVRDLFNKLFKHDCYLECEVNDHTNEITVYIKQDGAGLDWETVKEDWEITQAIYNLLENEQWQDSDEFRYMEEEQDPEPDPDEEPPEPDPADEWERREQDRLENGP